MEHITSESSDTQVLQWLARINNGLYRNVMDQFKGVDGNTLLQVSKQDLTDLLGLRGLILYNLLHPHADIVTHIKVC